ncbi:MAG: RrF2 family transcriptional regulator [Succinivibrio sp.]
MKISTKGRYALRLMIDLSEHRNNGFITLKDIAKRQGISKKYLEQIIPILNRANLLRTSRGYLGGYQLNREPENYTVGEILRLTEGNLAPVACLECDPVICPKNLQCPTLPIWKGLYDVINNYLDSITLQDILDKQHAMYANDYVI